MSNFSPAYIKSVYIERCKEGAFSPYLKNATEARVKKACLAAFKKKNSFSDKIILRNFLEVPEDGDLDLALKKAEVGKFRPIVNFFKNGTKDPRDQTTDLAAWLIDLKYEKLAEISNGSLKDLSNHPQEEKNQLEENKKEESTIDDVKSDKKHEFNDEKSSTNKRPIYKERAAIVALFAIIITITSVLASLLSSNKEDTKPFLNFTGKEKYMYWYGDHYQPTNSSQIKSSNVVPLNAKKVSDFKKITDPDTITTRSIGKIWYVKINNKPEFYTDRGFHPGDTLKKLRPLTKYMVEKYPERNKRLLQFLNSLFVLSLLVFSYSIIVLYKKRREKFPDN